MADLNEFRTELISYQKKAEARAEDELSKLRTKAERKIRDVDGRLRDIMRDSKEFEENISPDSTAMDKYSQKIYDALTEKIEPIEPPDKISHVNLTSYVENLRSALEELDETLIKYVKLLKDKKYKGRVKTLDKSLKRLNKDLKSLEDFISKDYAPNSSIEKAPEMITKTLDLVDEYDEKYEELEQKEDNIKEMDKQIEKLEKELEEIKHHPIKDKYQQLTDDYETTQREIDHTFGNIKKVFRKYDKLDMDTSDIDTNLMSNLVTDAASTLANLDSLNSVVSLLEHMNEVLEDTALNLNKEKRETAKADIEKFLNGKLQKLNSKATSIIEEKEKVSKQIKQMDLESMKVQAEETLAAAIRDRNRVYQRELRALEKIEKDVGYLMKGINSKLSRLLNEDINIETQLKPLPEWAEEK